MNILRLFQAHCQTSFLNVGSHALLPTPSPASSGAVVLTLHDAAGGKSYFIVVISISVITGKAGCFPICL